jgi:hypothetical protein
LERVRTKLAATEGNRAQSASVDVQMEYKQALELLVQMSESSPNIKLVPTAGLCENIETVALFIAKSSVDTDMRAQYEKASSLLADFGETETAIEYSPNMAFADKLQVVVEHHRNQAQEMLMLHDDADLLATALSKNDDLELEITKIKTTIRKLTDERDRFHTDKSTAEAATKAHHQTAMKNLTKLEDERSKHKKQIQEREVAVKANTKKQKSKHDMLLSEIRQMEEKYQTMKDQLGVKQSEVAKLVAGAKIEIEQLEREKTEMLAKLEKSSALLKVQTASQSCCCENRYNGRYLGQVPIPNNRPDQEILWNAIDQLKLQSANAARLDVTVMTVPGHATNTLTGKRWPKMLQMSTQSGRFSLSQPFHQILSVGQVEMYVVC